MAKPLERAPLLGVGGKKNTPMVSLCLFNNPKSIEMNFPRNGETPLLDLRETSIYPKISTQGGARNWDCFDNSANIDLKEIGSEKCCKA